MTTAPRRFFSADCVHGHSRTAPTAPACPPARRIRPRPGPPTRCRRGRFDDGRRRFGQDWRWWRGAARCQWRPPVQAIRRPSGTDSHGEALSRLRTVSRSRVRLDAGRDGIQGDGEVQAGRSCCRAPSSPAATHQVVVATVDDPVQVSRSAGGLYCNSRSSPVATAFQHRAIAVPTAVHAGASGTSCRRCAIAGRRQAAAAATG